MIDRRGEKFESKIARTRSPVRFGPGHSRRALPPPASLKRFPNGGFSLDRSRPACHSIEEQAGRLRSEAGAKAARESEKESRRQSARSLFLLQGNLRRILLFFHDAGHLPAVV